MRICQSCGMPLTTPDDLGTDPDGCRVSEFCRYCFQKGAFTEPDISAQQMIEKCAGIMAARGIASLAAATAQMSRIIPTLNRWRPVSADRPSPAADVVIHDVMERVDR